MNTKDIYRKTPLGLAEMEVHKLAMKPAARRTLILLDGTRSLDGMLPLFRDPKDLENILNELVQQGLIEKASSAGASGASSSLKPDNHIDAIENREDDLQPGRDPAQRFIDGQKFMNNAIREHLGFKAVFFTLKIERCGNVEDCLALLPDFEGALTKALKNDIRAEAIRKKAERILTI